jgi:hypothetical protein
MIRVRSRDVAALVVTIATALLAIGASSAATVTIGQTDPAASVPCTPSTGLYALQTVSAGASFTVPAGQWSVTSWSTYASGGQMGLMVFRPTGTPGSYTVVGESQPRTLTGPGLKTTSLAPNSADPPIAVQSGDLLGFWSQGPNSACGSGPASTSISAAVASSEPTVGSQVTPTPAATATVLDISATLTTPAPPAAAVPFDWAAWYTAQAHTGYCAVAGNTHPYTGTPIQPGTFLLLLSGQPTTDPHYQGATPANYFEGKGITCDAPIGYLPTGKTVGYGGAGDPGPYPYYTKA